MEINRQERYRQRLREKAGWFDDMNKARQAGIRQQIQDLRERGELTPEQDALTPFFLSHPSVQRLIAIEGSPAEGWVGLGSYEEACLAYIALKKITSAPVAMQFITNSGSGAVSEDSDHPTLREMRQDIERLKAHGLWVAE